MSVRTEFLETFGDRIAGPRSWRVRGRNFMTPSVVGYVRGLGGDLVEISTGYGFDDEPIIGVTYNRRDTAVDQRDVLVYSIAAAYEAIFGEAAPLEAAS